MNNQIKSQLVMFIIMTTLGITLNPMNVLANSIDDIYLSFTLVYGGMLMATIILFIIACWLATRFSMVLTSLHLYEAR